MVTKGRAVVDARLADLRVVRSLLLSPPRVDEHGEKSPHPYHRLTAEECCACRRGGRRSTGHPPSRVRIARTAVGGWAQPCMGAGGWGARLGVALLRRAARSQSRQGQDRHRGTPGGPQQHQASGVCGLAGLRASGGPPPFASSYAGLSNGVPLSSRK